MFFHMITLIGKVLAEEFAIFEIKLRFLTNIASQTRLETVKKVDSWCLPICPLFYLTWLRFYLTVCHQSLKLKGRKFSRHPYARDLAVGFWLGSEGRETAQFDYTVCGFNQLKGQQLPPEVIKSPVNHRKKELVLGFYLN